MLQARKKAARRVAPRYEQQVIEHPQMTDLPRLVLLKPGFQRLRIDQRHDSIDEHCCRVPVRIQSNGAFTIPAAAPC
jgi:hypothetical protein